MQTEMEYTKDTIILRKLKVLKELCAGQRVQIPAWHTRSGMMYCEDGIVKYRGVTSGEPDLHPGDTWECRDDFTRWFSADVTIPDSFAGMPAALDLSLGGEGIVRADGKIIFSLTQCRDAEDWVNRSRVMLAESAEAGRVYHVEVETHLNYGEFAGRRVAGAESEVYTIRRSDLITVDRAAEDYYFALNTAFHALLTLRNPLDAIAKSPSKVPYRISEFLDGCNRDSYYYDRVRDAVACSASALDFDLGREALRASVPEAARILDEKLAAVPNGPHALVKLVGQAHIDTAWLWPIRESIRKTAQTFANVVSLMDQYPDLTFAFSQPQLFEYLKENYPELYEQVKEKVREGRFELVGNSWVEMDTNLPSGESLVRQLLYGRAFFRKEFGKCSDVFWMPDVFGYTWALPQIIKRSGMKYFYTSKLNNNDDNRFPFSLFRWQGIDGTQVTSYLQRMGYNSDTNPESIAAIYARFDQKGLSDESLLTFGHGDGGGGPTFEMLETQKHMKCFPGFPKTEMSTSESFFRGTDASASALPVWNDEMYYEFHRGTYTSQAFVKKGNRSCELLYRSAEMANAFAHADLAREYPYEELLRGYKIFLTNQFHDILPGSSVHPVYEDVRLRFRKALGIGEELRAQADAALAEKAGGGADCAVVFNDLSNVRSGMVSVSLKGTRWENAGAVSAAAPDGTVCPGEMKDGVLTFFAPEMPPLGYAAFSLRGEKAPVREPARAGLREMENRFFRISLDENGNLTQLTDKRCGREVFSGPSNVLKVFEDKPGGESAWNIDREYQNKEWALTRAQSVRVEKESGLSASVRVVRRFHDSEITQDIVIYSDVPRIDFITHAEWQESEKLLKAEFNADILSSRAAYEIQFGAIERTTHDNTSYDRTKFEVSGHKWADLSEGAYGLSILNDCKYGYDIRGGRMRISLLRAPVNPDPTGDRGPHDFTYSIFPHEGDWRTAGTVSAAYSLNAPFRSVFRAQAGEGTLPAVKSYASCDRPNVILDTVKCAEDGNGVILRVYESIGAKTNVVLTTAFGAKSVTETNLMEENETAVPAENGSFRFTIRPFEVKTFRLA